MQRDQISSDAAGAVAEKADLNCLTVSEARGRLIAGHLI
tara:strand:- start:39 stop:155 length:117 start_codon:yes stop_codon:yes gene_type:complete